jgi:hypothetical protein
VGGVLFTVNVRSVVQNGFGLFAGICSGGVKGGVGGTKGGNELNNSELGAGNPGAAVTFQETSPPRTLGQVVVTASVNVTLGPSGLGAHTVSTFGRGKNLLQSSAVTKLKT